MKFGFDRLFTMTAATGLAVMASIGFSGIASATPVITNGEMTVTINQIGDSFTAMYVCEGSNTTPEIDPVSCKGREGDNEQIPVDDLEANITYTVEAINATDGDVGNTNAPDSLLAGDSILFKIVIDNLTETDSSITNFGVITLMPEPTDIDLGQPDGPSGWFADGNINSSGFQEVDFCASVEDQGNTGTATCTGGASNGVDSGDHETIYVVFTFGDIVMNGAGDDATYTFDTLDGFSLTNPTIKFQGATDGGSFEFLGMFKRPPEIPEPGTMGLLGAALFGFGAMGRRKRKKAA